MFSKLLGVPERDIPESHEEMVAFAGLSMEALMRKLYDHQDYSLTGELDIQKVDGQNSWVCGESTLRSSSQLSNIMNLKVSSDSPLLKKQQQQVALEAQYTVCDHNIKQSDGSIEANQLRQEAAKIADIDADSLPGAKDLKEMVDWLFHLLVEEKGGKVTAAKMIVCMKVFDDQIPISVVNDTLLAVEAMDTLDARRLYHWVVLMFGDCSEEEFLSNVLEFGEAAKTIRGLKFK